MLGDPVAEDIEDSVGGRSPNDKLLVTRPLHVVKSFGGKETGIAVRASPQGLEKSLILGLPLKKLAQAASWQRGTRLTHYPLLVSPAQVQVQLHEQCTHIY